jgi:hypothetical protein
MVGLQFSDRSYADKEITIPCINPERTYLEKLFLLHEEFQKPTGKIRVDRLSRHLYNIHQIAQSEYKEKAHDVDLIKEIIAHRERFNGMKGVDYSTHYPPSLNSLPPEQFLKSWGVDYRKKQEEMIPIESLSFRELIDSVKNEVAEYNALRIVPSGKLFFYIKAAFMVLLFHLNRDDHEDRM